MPKMSSIALWTRWSILLGTVALLLTVPALAQWRPIGPYGGNARALAYDPAQPDHVLLGSGAGTLFESKDGGRHWQYFAHLGFGQDLMLENIAFDLSRPGVIYVAGWSVTGSGGGFFVSRNGGRSWQQAMSLRNKSIQALALADSVPGMLIVGALDGLYRSTNWGESWVRITPERHSDLKNFESVAIDPHDPKIIYAGTWHLPWKTSDGGVHWNVIKQGVIDDSDVFSIILDHSNPQTVFASACSGIYKSENGGDLFHKIQGIPGTARRTRVLQQDPRDAHVVYAGTTEGLWKTTDGGTTFKLISPPNYILNDVLVDPRDSRRVLIATDRGGVFASEDAGATFHPSNDGFSQRQISAVVVDSEQHSDLYASVLNDKEFGGVFHLHDGIWSPLGGGLEALDVFDLAQSTRGELVAATSHGVFLFEAASRRWVPSREVVSQEPVSPRKPVRGKSGKTMVSGNVPPRIVHSQFEGHVASLALGSRWFAATENGLLVSDDEGKGWKREVLDGQEQFIAVSSLSQAVAVASLRGVWYSRNQHEHWLHPTLPEWISRIYSLTIASSGELWIGTREGAFCWSPERGVWEHVLNGLPAREIISMHSDGELLLAVTAGSQSVYVSRDQGRQWRNESDSGFEISGAIVLRGALHLVTIHNGLLTR